MSNHLVSDAYKANAGSLLRKALLVLLADKASDDGSGIWASKNTMAKELCCSRRAVIKTLKEFAEEGLINEVGKRECAAGYTVEYRIDVAKLQALITPETRFTREPRSPGNDIQPPREPRSPKPPKNLSEAKASRDRVVAQWNKTAPKNGLSPIRTLSNSRTQSLNARLREVGEATLLEAIERITKSKFLCGESDRPFKADFDFLLQPKSLTRILEGFYGEDRKHAAALTPTQIIKNLEASATLHEMAGRDLEANECRRKAEELRKAA